MSKRWLQRIGVFAFVFFCAVLAAVVPVRATTIYNESEIRGVMEQAFASGDLEVSITMDRIFSVDINQAKQEADVYARELIGMLEEAALKNGRLMNGTAYSFTIVDGRTVTYKFDISAQFTKKVTVLTSEKNAYQQALRALQERDYSTNFYSEEAMYYDTFVLALQHHPEYNYNLKIWKSTDGTCGYRLGSKLAASSVKSKMSKADAKADAVLDKIITKGMTNKQKLKAIHDYLVRYCVYDETAPKSGYDDAYTAYGCLIKKKAVCQGYSAAFNLMAMKLGIRSIAVSGNAGGYSHGWNYVKNGNTYRYVDATWDDPVPDRGSKAAVKQTYFYLTEKQLEKIGTHSWDKTEHAKKYVDLGTVLLP